MTMGTKEGGSQQQEARDPISRARAVGYSEEEVASVPPEAILGMGCGNPVALATLLKGEVVVDLGCGGGFDVFLAAAQVGPSGLVIGVDHSVEMLEIARAAAARGGYANVEFRLGAVEHLPVGDGVVDAVISNCVISDVADRRAAFAEAARVLKPGGRALISDLVLTSALPDDLSTLPDAWAGWVARAPSREQYLDCMGQSGLRDVVIVHEEAFTSPGTPVELVGRIASILVGAFR